MFIPFVCRYWFSSWKNIFSFKRIKNMCIKFFLQIFILFYFFIVFFSCEFAFVCKTFLFTLAIKRKRNEIKWNFSNLKFKSCRFAVLALLERLFKKNRSVFIATYRRKIVFIVSDTICCQLPKKNHLNENNW